jgi:hypothetical protein
VFGRETVAALAAAALVGALAVTPGAGARNATSTHYTGTTPDAGGGSSQWIADVPSPWNGTVLLYSHGFGPLLAADAPDPVTQQELLNERCRRPPRASTTTTRAWARRRSSRSFRHP